MKQFRSFGQYSLFIVPSIIILGIILLSFSVLFPTVNLILSTQPTLTSKKAELDELVKKRQFLNKFDEAYLPLLQDATLALPGEKDAAGVLISLDNISKKTGAGVDDISFSPGKVSTDSAVASAPNTPVVESSLTKFGASLVSVDLSVLGEATQIKDFITALTSSRRLFSIRSLNLVFSQESDVITTQMVVDAFYLPPITEISGTSALLPELTQAEKDTLTKVAALPDVSTIQTGDQTDDLSNQIVGKTDLFAP